MRIACIGSGLIGRGWAIVFARAGHDVRLFDTDSTAVPAALAAIDATLADMAPAGLLDEPADAIRARISGAGSLEAAIEAADHVQESIRETVDAKRTVFAALDAVAPASAGLASSSSAIVASRFTEGLTGRGRCLVAHPVNPPHLVPLVELVPAPWTDRAVVERTRSLMDGAGMAPIVLEREITGFVLNRLQHALMREAFALVESGHATVEDVDTAVREGLGLRWSFIGPFEVGDLNAPGGIADYCRRYGSDIHAMGGMEGRTWPDALIEAVERQRRARLPVDRLADRQAWRDRRLMALAAHKRAAARDVPEE